MTDTTPTTRTEADAVADVALASSIPNVLDDGKLYSVIVPTGATAQVLDTHDQVAARAPQPKRRRGTVKAQDAASLSRLVTDLGPENGVTRIYADITDTTVTAVLNDHLESDGSMETGNAGWGDHRVTLGVARTEDWKRWLKRDGDIGEQLHFAEHIEDLLHTVVEPAAADLLELAQTFEAKVDAQFASGNRLSDGTRQLTWVEQVDARAGTEGRLAIPERITISVEPFEGSAAVAVEARLRFRVRNGHLSIGYVLDRPDRVERQAFDSVVEEIGKATGSTPYLAKPPTLRGE